MMQLTLAEPDKSIVNLQDLTVLQIRAIEALLQTNNIPEAAKLAGCSDSSIDRWLKLPKFQQCLNEGKKQAFNLAVQKLSVGSRVAVDALLELSADKDVAASVRVRAAEVILAQSIRLNEISQLQDRVAALEAMNE